jgi:DNA-binding CsgD family transcriptional regulator
MTTGLDIGFEWSPGSIGRWLWELGEMSEAPPGIAVPYGLLMRGEWAEAASTWEAREVPFERALTLMHGGQVDRLEALEALEGLGATAVAARLRRELRGAGVSVPRGRSREARRHPAGLTARQAEILGLLHEGLSNAQIADRLFLSPRTVESHVTAVLDKLGVSTRKEAASRARADGIIGDTA